MTQEHTGDNKPVTQASQAPTALTGALVGGLLTLPLIIVFQLSANLLGTAFVPIDGFDWLIRNLPGGLLTFGVDTMVDFLIGIGLGADLDTTAKTVEQFMGLGLFVLMGAIIGALTFALARRRFNNAYGIATILSLGWGIVLLRASDLVNVSATASPIINLSLGAMFFLGWGMGIAWAYDELQSLRTVTTSAETTTNLSNADEARVSSTVMNRRQFLVRMGGATAAFTVVGAGLGALLNNSFAGGGRGGGTTTPLDPGDFVDGSGTPLPNWDDPVLPAPGTRAEYTPLAEHYRIDILAGGLPSIDEETYTLPIMGLVANEVNWSLSEIREMPSVDSYITMACISNRIAGSLIGTTKWTGVPLQYILDQIQPNEDAVALHIFGADDFDEYVSLDLIRQDERIMLAYNFDDQPLPLRNGFPLRIHIPDRYGMKQPKWITRIEVVDENGAGYWVRRGWSADAFVRATSVIDTVAVNDAYLDDDGTTWRVPIGGIAWAGARGISKVEISIDDGEWTEVELRSPMSDRTWTIWRYDWAFEEGFHDFAVRCYDGAGELQILEDNPVRPDGATGVHRDNAIFPDPADLEEMDEEATPEANEA
jgi:DMSO/TMAO reductase YedYZ molybdopterin-dependent catalytic subunit